MRLAGHPDSDCCRALKRLLGRYSLELRVLESNARIPGSHWGAPEAGLIGAVLYARADTPVHSVLHEACHYICMDPDRRRTLHTDAGGSALEECAVCYLSILLADAIPGFSQAAMLADMDAWGYSFRLGTAGRWFHEDADDARQWLREHGLMDDQDQPCRALRQV